MQITIRNLEHAGHAKSVAVVGASVHVGSVVPAVVNTIVAGGFEGEIFTVNPKYRKLTEDAAFQATQIIPGV